MKLGLGSDGLGVGSAGLGVGWAWVSGSALQVAEGGCTEGARFEASSSEERISILVLSRGLPGLALLAVGFGFAGLGFGSSEKRFFFTSSESSLARFGSGVAVLGVS